MKQDSQTTPTHLKKKQKTDYMSPFAELASMVDMAIERGDIDLLQMLIEDDEVAVSEWHKWRQDHDN